MSRSDVPTSVGIVEHDSILATSIMRLFEHWRLSTEQQLLLLGLSPKNRSSLTRYRKGSPLPDSRDVSERAGILLGIHKSLRLLFPHNRELVYGWMSQPNKAFEGKAPVTVAAEQGFPGLLMVRAYLDRARGR